MKKTLALVLVLALALSSFGGCGKKASNIPAENAEKKEQKGTEQQETTTDEPVTLKILLKKHELTDDLKDNPIFIKAAEKANVKIQWEYVGVDWDTQKSLVLMSDNLPDIFMGKTLEEKDMVGIYSLFQPLDDLIDQHAPNIKQMFEKEPAIKKFVTAPDGKIYGLPQKMPAGAATLEMGMLNKQWLKNLGLHMPKTTDELYTVLKAFKEQDANGNGDPNDEIPLTFIGFEDLVGLYGLLGSFGVSTSTGEPALSVTDGKVNYAPATEGFKNMVAFLAKLNTEGIIDPEAFTQDWSLFPSKLDPEGDSIVGLTFHWTIGAAMKPERAAEYTIYEPVKGAEEGPYWRPNPFIYSKYRFEVTKNCKNPEAAIRFADALFDPETSLEIAYGPIGKTINKEDGKYVLLNPPEDMPASQWQWKYSLNSEGLGYAGDAVVNNLVLSGDAANKFSYDRTYKNYFPEEWYPVLAFGQEQQDELAILKTDMENFWKEAVAKWVVNGGVEKEWDDYLKSLDNMQLDAMLKIYQEAYDNYIGK